MIRVLLLYLLACSNGSSQKFPMSIPTSIESVTFKNRNQLVSLEFPTDTIVFTHLDELKQNLEKLDFRGICKIQIRDIVTLAQNLFTIIKKNNTIRTEETLGSGIVIPIVDAITRSTNAVALLIRKLMKEKTREKRNARTTFISIGLNGEQLRPSDYPNVCTDKQARNIPKCVNAMLSKIRSPVYENIGSLLINYILKMNPEEAGHQKLTRLADKLDIDLPWGASPKAKYDLISNRLKTRLKEGGNEDQRVTRGTSISPPTETVTMSTISDDSQTNEPLARVTPSFIQIEKDFEGSGEETINTPHRTPRSNQGGDYENWLSVIISQLESKQVDEPTYFHLKGIVAALIEFKTKASELESAKNANVQSITDMKGEIAELMAVKGKTSKESSTKFKEVDERLDGIELEAKNFQEESNANFENVRKINDRLQNIEDVEIPNLDYLAD